MRRALPLVTLLLTLLQSACKSPDPKQELELLDLEAYWAIERPIGTEQYIAPVVRFEVRNKGTQAWRSIQASATFRRQGDAEDWSSAFQIVKGRGGKPLEVGEQAGVILKPEGEGRYHSPDAPEAMFGHRVFKDVSAKVFLRLGASYPTLVAEIPVERRIGTKALLPSKP